MISFSLYPQLGNVKKVFNVVSTIRSLESKRYPTVNPARAPSPWLDLPAPRWNPRNDRFSFFVQDWKPSYSDATLYIYWGRVTSVPCISYQQMGRQIIIQARHSKSIHAAFFHNKTYLLTIIILEHAVRDGVSCRFFVYVSYSYSSKLNQAYESL